MLFRIDTHRLARAARQKLSRHQRTPEERRLDELRRLAPISSLHDIGRPARRWTCEACGDDTPVFGDLCLRCGSVLSGRRGVR